jgi:hypothetical protein
MILNAYESSSSTFYSCQILMNFEFSRQIFEKYSNIKFQEKMSSGTKLFHVDRRKDRQIERQTDRYDETNSRFSQFRERA